MTQVSVIIPTYNRAQKVLRAVRSVLNQTFLDFELIVVDDGSTDDTAGVLSRYKEKIHYLYQPNKGPSSARNLGVMESSGEYLAFLDSDDYWLPQKLATQIQFFHTHPQALICQTDEQWYRRGKRVNPKKIHMKPSGHMFEASLKLCLISPSAVMMKRWLFEQAGGFDEALPACEDYDLWLRITKDYPVYLIERPLVIKEGGHKDQLSARYWGMDRFRIYAIAKLMVTRGLTGPQKRAAKEELCRKCKIYALGCEKRGKIKEAQFFHGLPDMLRAGASEGLFDKIISYFK